MPLRRRVALRERRQIAVGPDLPGRQDDRGLPEEGGRADEAGDPHGVAAARRRAGALPAAAVRPQRRGGAQTDPHQRHPQLGVHESVVRGGVPELRVGGQVFRQKLPSDTAEQGWFRWQCQSRAFLFIFGWLLL